MTTFVLSLVRLACVAEGYLLTDVGSRVLDKVDAGFLQGPEGLHRVRIRENADRGLMNVLAIRTRAERRNLHQNATCRRSTDE